MQASTPRTHFRRVVVRRVGGHVSRPQLCAEVRVLARQRIFFVLRRGPASHDALKCLCNKTSTAAPVRAPTITTTTTETVISNETRALLSTRPRRNARFAKVVVDDDCAFPDNMKTSIQQHKYIMFTLAVCLAARCKGRTRTQRMRGGTTITHHHRHVHRSVLIRRQRDVVFGVEVPVLLRRVPRHVRFVKPNRLACIRSFICSFGQGTTNE